jgi:hypothetical protein
VPNPRISVSPLKQLILLRSNQLSTRDSAPALPLSQGAVSLDPSVIDLIVNT